MQQPRVAQLRVAGAKGSRRTGAQPRFRGKLPPTETGPYPTSMRSSTSATLLGTGAIVLWSSLASLTVLKGAVPPLQTTAIAFAVGGLVLIAAAVLRGRLSYLRPTRASRSEERRVGERGSVSG